MAFTHLHLHTEYSLLDGACKIGPLVSYAKKQGFESLAITDHGVMYGVIDFYRACKKENIKPIIGCEVYVAPRTRFDKTYELDKEYYHLVLLCENNIGYQNLIKLVSLGYTEGFYNKPRVDDEILSKYSEGLICLSACLAGEIPQRLLVNDFDSAKEKVLKYQKIFGKDNFFIELQNHDIEEEKQILPYLIRLSDETGAKLVATNDCHYISKDDYKMHEILLCIQTNKTINDENKMEFKTNEFYLKSEEEMRELFSSRTDAIENTSDIAKRCNVEFVFGERKLPDYKVPNNEDHYEYFKRKCYEGLYKHYTDNPDKDLVERLEYELSVIKRMGFVDYFLIVNDFVQFAKSVDIPVGPGRGSGAGSLCAYCIGITGIDPIKYNLLFERFLNPERVSMPDFDIDFCQERRHEVIGYVIDKYGADHVAQIVAFGTLKPRAAIRDAGRALAIPYSTVDIIAKLIPFEIGITIERAMILSPELKKLYDTDMTAHELIDVAKSIEGMPRNITIHAAGVVITDRPVNDYVPLSKSDESIVTQFTMTTLEELGLLKMDFLGLRNLTVIHDAVELIRKNEKDFSIDEIDYEDSQVFHMISQGNTDGVFQFESSGLKNVLQQLKPNKLEDLIAVTSLYRPGPMDSIPTYINNRHHPEKIKYKHKLLEPILNVTNGCIVYQEQVMQIFRSLAGYSLGRADIVRRAMSKKKHDVMEKEKEIFVNGLIDENGNVEVEGCIRRGVDEKTALSIFSEMESFASYAFNKSHAAAYATVAYQTAFLKCHYKKEYMAALLSSVEGDINKTAIYISECHRLGIKVLPPHVNYSFSKFAVDHDGIRFGLLGIKNLGYNIIDEIIKERELNGLYKSYYDFCKRINGKGLNSKALESIIKCGALDDLDCNRKSMLSVMKTILEDLEYQRKQGSFGQMSIFDMDNTENVTDSFSVPYVEEFPLSDMLLLEKEILGIYISGHPLDEYKEYTEKIKSDNIVDIINSDDHRKYHDQTQVRVIGIISKVKNQITKSNQMMAFVTVEDKSAVMEVLVFPNTYASSSSNIYAGAVVDISGKLSFKEEEEPKLLADSIKPLATESDDTNVKEKKLYVKIKSLNGNEYKKLKTILEEYPGKHKVVLYVEDTKKQFVSSDSLWIEDDEYLFIRLEDLLGKGSVIFK